MPSDDGRSRALDELEESVRDWIDKRRDAINNEVSYLKSVLNGTTGSSTLRRKNAETAGIFQKEELADFIQEIQ